MIASFSFFLPFDVCKLMRRLGFVAWSSFHCSCWLSFFTLVVSYCKVCVSRNGSCRVATRWYSIWPTYTVFITTHRPSTVCTTPPSPYLRGPVYLTGYTVSVASSRGDVSRSPNLLPFLFHCTAWALASLPLIFISLMPRVQNATRGCVIFMWHPLIGSRD